MTKYLGKTTTIADGTGTLGEVKEITMPEIAIDVLDTTVYDSTYWKTSCAGLKDGGSLGVTVFYDGADASQNRMYQRAIGDPSANTDTYTITLPDAKTMIFTGIIESWSPEVPIDDNIMVAYSIKVSGAITGTLGA